MNQEKEHKHPPIDSNTAKEMETILNDEEVKSSANYARKREDDTYFCIQPQVDGTKTTSIGSSGYAGIRQAIKNVASMYEYGTGTLLNCNSAVKW